jgi:serine O-acetyltransferase
MIRSRSDYLAYLEADRVAIGRVGRPPLMLLQDPIWYFLRLLRATEYQLNCGVALHERPWQMWTKLQFKRARLLLGFNVPPNTCGPGLNLVHEGDILINTDARIGSYARINTGVVIGSGRRDEDIPVLGSHIVIEAGAKIFGGIQLADWTHVGANAVVNKSVTEPGKVIAGVPAKVIGDDPRYPGAAK